MQTWINEHTFVFVCLMVAGVFVFRWLLLNLIAAASGWRILAARFSAQRPRSGPEWKWQSAVMRFSIGYNHCLRLVADPMGLLIQPMWGIRTAHPPLFIPWYEIRIEPATGWMKNSFVQLRVGLSERIPLNIRRSLVMKLKAAAGTAWPTSPGVPVQTALL